MDQVCKQVVASCGVIIAETSARITSAELPVVLGDANQMRQLLQNLLVNAIKFRRPETVPEIHISVGKEEKRWVFSIRDNGIGIPPEQQERIFNIFQRLHSRQKYVGSGIGLAVCRRIVEQHGGRIWVESTPDNGSIFLFTLPTHMTQPQNQFQEES